MSRSPRRSLRMAQHALIELFSVCERYPEARAELVKAIGEEGVREVQAAQIAIERAAARLDSPDHTKLNGSQLDDR